MEQVLRDEIKARVLPLLEGKGVELVDLLISRGRKRFVLRFLVDKPGGITLDECAGLNRDLGHFFEQENMFDRQYILEVASPGLDRPLKSDRDFQRNMGNLVKVALHRPLDRQNVWVGVISGVDEKSLVIRTENHGELRITREDIAWARLEINSGAN
jgi:ribosome maturation factor RimP